MSQSASIFGADGDRFIEMIDSLELSASKVRYTFTANEDFKRGSWRRWYRGCGG